ncbi:MAG: hypothetical protein ACJ8DZ_05435 [Allosphingosinicella sp.]
MRRLLTAATILAAIPAAASAQDVTGTVTINATVAQKCLFTTPSATITIPELAGADGKLDPATVNGQTKTLVGWCNGTAATMAVAATPITTAAPGGASFDNRVDYTATALANAVSANDTSTIAGAGTPQTVGVFSGDIVVTLSGAASPGGKLLLAGAYTGNVTVTLSPTVALP